MATELVCNQCQKKILVENGIPKEDFFEGKKQWGYLKAIGADKYLGKKINGYIITQSGLLAGAHLKGAGSVIKYLKSNGKYNPADAFGTSVESYMKRFAGYYVSKICI